MNAFQLSMLPMDTAYYIPDFITEQEEQQLLKQVYAAPKPKWITLSNRRLQNWGGIPDQRGMLVEPLPDWLIWPLKRTKELQWPIFPTTAPANHCLVNEYLAGQGIMPHEDGPMYLPCVATLSLGSHTVLDFTARDKSATNTISSFSLFLEPRSLFIQRDQVYQEYLHGIAEYTTDDLSDERVSSPLLLPPPESYHHSQVERGTRISLTYRRVVKCIKTPKFLQR